MTATARGLTSDGLALSAGVAVTAVIGVVTWWVAARALPVAEVGLASAFVSGFVFVASLSGLNLGVALLRWVPRAGSRAPALVARASLGVVVLSAVVACGYLLLPGTAAILPAATGGEWPAVAGGAAFVLAAAAWSLFQLHDLALAALGVAWWAPLKNVVVSGLRLAVLVAAGAGLTAHLVVGTWVVPTVACALVVGLLVAVRARRVPQDGALPDRREVVGFLGPTHLGQLAFGLLTFQIPVIVTLRYGPAAGGAFFVAWQVVTVVDVAASRFVSALVGHVARWPDRADELCRTARVRVLVLFLPVIAVGVLVAGPALAVFGPDYTGAAWVLRTLLVAAAVRLLVLHALGVRQALGDAWGFARLQGLSSVPVVVGALVVPVGGADPAAVLPVALCYLGVQVACAVAVLLRGVSRWPTAVRDR